MRSRLDKPVIGSGMLAPIAMMRPGVAASRHGEEAGTAA